MPKKEPKEKKSRSVGVNLFLKGERSASPKGAMVRKPYPPGAHGKNRRLGSSEFGRQLLEKQRVKWTYGLRERQFKKYFVEASKIPGATGEIIMRRLERRLDNAVFRLGWAVSRSIARQLVSHGHILVNEKKVTIPSYQVRVNDVLCIRPRSRPMKQFEDLDARLEKHEPPLWLFRDAKTSDAKVLKEPEGFDVPFDLSLVVDFYSR